MNNLRRTVGLLLGVVSLSLGLVAPGQCKSNDEIYARAMNQFALADFFKPVERQTDTLPFKLAPLILQEAPGEGKPAATEQFGELVLTPDGVTVGTNRATVYVEADNVEVRGRNHPRFTYVWAYTVHPLRDERVALQGVRITLNGAGEPVIWEILSDPNGRQLIYVAESLEAAAAAEFGPPLTGRKYSSERDLKDAPRTVVARVIADGPVPMGPFLYPRSGSHSVSTLICRCMPAQAKRVRTTSTYELRHCALSAPGSLPALARKAAKAKTAFWPGEDARTLESCLRLPANF